MLVLPRTFELMTILFNSSIFHPDRDLDLEMLIGVLEMNTVL